MNAKLIVLSIMLLHIHALFAQNAPTSLTHKVAEKENLYRIALKYGTSVAQIEAMNPTLKSEKIKIGMKLVVPIPAGGTSAILPGPARAPKSGSESAAVVHKTKVEIPANINSVSTTNNKMEEQVSSLQKEVDINNTMDSTLSKKRGKVVKKLLNTSYEKTEKLSLDYTSATSAEERKNELLQLAKNDQSIVVVTTLRGSNSYIAQDINVPVKVEPVKELKQASSPKASQLQRHDRKPTIEERDLSNPPSAASLRKVLLAAEHGEDMIVNLQIVMKDGAVICVTDPSVQLQLVSELLQVQHQ